MPVPPEYERASTQFYDFLHAAKENADLQTTNQAYTMTQGVLRAFRRRLTFQQAILFANELPLLLRALFVTDWDLEEKQLPFAEVETMTKEVQALRADHNWSPPNSIAAVAKALERYVYPDSFAATLERLPPGAKEFWRG